MSVTADCKVSFLTMFCLHYCSPCTAVLKFGIWPFVTTYFSAIVLTFCDWFQRFGIRPHDWWVSFPTPHSCYYCTDFSQLKSVSVFNTGAWRHAFPLCSVMLKTPNNRFKQRPFISFALQTPHLNWCLLHMTHHQAFNSSARALNKVGRYHYYWDEILLQSFSVFCAAKNACCFITNNLNIFMLLEADALCFYYCTFLEPIRIVQTAVIPMASLVTVNHECH